MRNGAATIIPGPLGGIPLICIGAPFARNGAPFGWNGGHSDGTALAFADETELHSQGRAFGEKLGGWIGPPFACIGAPCIRIGPPFGLNGLPFMVIGPPLG